MISLIPRSNKWEVEEEYKTEVLGKTVVVPKGFISDLASIPRTLWVFLPPFGRYTEASVVHDYLYLASDFSRKECDDIFLALMLRSGTNKVTAKIVYKVVRWFGWLYF